ncbi:MAG: AAA family ATPase, partial [Actinomycetota bacterium]
MPTDTITVRLLGGFAIQAGGRVLSSLPPQAVSLLSFLVVNRARPQTRDLLAGRFWPEQPEDRARKRLSNCLWQIKRGLGDAGLPEDLLIADNNTVSVAATQSLVVDAEEFESQLSEFERELRGRQVKGVLTDRLADVVSSYPGEFLSGYYHEWIEPERKRIRDRYHSALAELIGLYKSRSQYDVALRFARMLVEEEPLREDLHREVMRLHALLDQAPAAERQFATCQRMLQNELGLEPSEETVALLERIRSDAPAPAQAYQVDDPEQLGLIGRRHEMSVLVGRADELLSGRGGVVLVEGEPGIGKTRLLREFMEAAEWRGARILHAGHTELSRMQPYSALREVLAPAVTGLRGAHLVEVVESVWLQKAAEVLPELRGLLEGSAPSQPLLPAEEPARMSEALARVVQAQGGLGPTVIVIEDVHWSDDDSMQVLAQLGPRLARSDVLLCLSYRRFEAEQAASVWSDLGKLEGLAAASRLVVGPMSTNEVRDLLTAHLGPGGLPASTVAKVVELTNGNPLYVLESVRDPASLVTDLGDERGEDVPLLPPAVARSLEVRVEALAGPTRAVLETLAALAEPASPTLVAEVAGMQRLATVEALTQTTDLGFVIDEADGSCRFSHDQTRRMVYKLMGPDRGRELHRRIYEAQASSGAPPAQLAHHARLAGQMSETRQWHLEAAKAALTVNGYRTAADHYGQADDA